MANEHTATPNTLSASPSTMSKLRPGTSRMTPLWITALFLSLAETVASITAIQTSGNPQLALVGFVIAFPTLVAAAFFTILWNRPYVLYPPTEYGEQPNVRQFVEAMQRRRTDDDRLFRMFAMTIKDTLTSEAVTHELATSLAGPDEESAAEVASEFLKSLAASATQRIQANVITIDVSPILGDCKSELRFPYDPNTCVIEMLESVFYFVAPKVKPYSFGTAWTLKDAASGKVLDGLCMDYSAGTSEGGDGRTLSEVGITPGMHLIAFLL